MGCSCARDGAYKVVVSNKLQPLNREIKDNENTNQIQTINPSAIQTNLNNVSLSKVEKSSKDHFNVNIVFASGEIKQIFIPDHKKEYMTVMDLLNKALFNSKELDCNFISQYNAKTDKYEYQIERIKSLVSKNTLNNSKSIHSKKNTDKKIKDTEENGVWEIYIDNQKECLSELIDECRVIHKEKSLYIKFVKRDSHGVPNNTCHQDYQIAGDKSELEAKD